MPAATGSDQAAVPAPAGSADAAPYRVVDGDHGTQNGKDATGMGLDAMRLQAARLSLPELLIEKRETLRMLEDRVIEIPLRVPPRPGSQDRIVVDITSGGVMRAEDGAGLKKMRVKKVMLQDTPSQKIIDTLKKLFAERRPR